jgi:AcrR family transcriptional regulator
MKRGDKTKRKILDAGLKLWRDDPRSVNFRNIAEKINMTHPAVLYHFGEDTLRDAVAAHAVQVGDSRIIVQLMAMKHPAVSSMSDADRRRHAAVVSG